MSVVDTNDKVSINSLEETLNQSQKNPFVISVSHWLSAGPVKFQYKFICSSKLDQDEDKQFYRQPQKCTVEIRQAGKKKIVSRNFIIFHTSEKTAVIVCEKLHGMVIDPAICIPIKYSHVNKCWTAESSYHNITSLFTFGGATSGFGLLTEIGCTNMKMKIYSQEMKMKISCHGPGGMNLNESQFVDADDFPCNDSLTPLS